MKFKADWFKEEWFKNDRKDNLPNLQDTFIAFEFDKEKFGDTLKNQMKKMKITMHGVGWGEIAVCPGQYKAETHGNILLFGKFELGQKLNEEEKKEAMDDLSTLTPHTKYRVKFINSVMTLFGQGILKLAWEICKKSNNFEENYRDSLQYAFLQRAKEVVEKNRKVYSMCAVF